MTDTNRPPMVRRMVRAFPLHWCLNCRRYQPIPVRYWTGFCVVVNCAWGHHLASLNDFNCSSHARNFDFALESGNCSGQQAHLRRTFSIGKIHCHRGSQFHAVSVVNCFPIGEAVIFVFVINPIDNSSIHVNCNWHIPTRIIIPPA